MCCRQQSQKPKIYLFPDILLICKMQNPSFCTVNKCTLLCLKHTQTWKTQCLLCLFPSFSPSSLFHCLQALPFLQLICINGKCNDDPHVGTHTCTGERPSPPSNIDCKPSGTLRCEGKSFPRFTCSPPVTSFTKASLTLNDFSEGEEVGAPSECDENFHEKTERVVALSTGWYAGGSRCGKMIKITARNGRSVLAKVVDECDSKNGCDSEHAGLPPCRNNIVDGSDAVWEALKLNKDLGVVDVTWSLAQVRQPGLIN